MDAFEPEWFGESGFEEACACSQSEHGSGDSMFNECDAYHLDEDGYAYEDASLWDLDLDAFFRNRSLYDNGDASDPKDYRDEYFHCSSFWIDDEGNLVGFYSTEHEFEDVEYGSEYLDSCSLREHAQVSSKHDSISNILKEIDEYFSAHDINGLDADEDIEQSVDFGSSNARDDRAVTDFDVIETWPPPYSISSSDGSALNRFFFTRNSKFLEEYKNTLISDDNYIFTLTPDPCLEVTRADLHSKSESSKEVETDMDNIDDGADKMENNLNSNKEDRSSSEEMQEDHCEEEEDYEDASAMMLMDSFYIDDGSIDKVEARRAFVLGVEWAIFRNYIVGCDILASEPFVDEDGERHHDEGFEFFCHDENVERLKRLSAMHMRLAKSETVGEGWSVISVGKRDDFLNQLLK